MAHGGLGQRCRSFHVDLYAEDCAHFSNLVFQQAQRLYLDQDDPCTDLPPDGGTSPAPSDDDPFGGEHIKWVREAIAKLPAKQAAVVQEMFFRGRGYKEIHEQTGEPEVNLRQDRFRALTLLQKLAYDRFPDLRETSSELQK